MVASAVIGLADTSTAKRFALHHLAVTTGPFGVGFRFGKIDPGRVGAGLLCLLNTSPSATDPRPHRTQLPAEVAALAASEPWYWPALR